MDLKVSFRVVTSLWRISATIELLTPTVAPTVTTCLPS